MVIPEGEELERLRARLAEREEQRLYDLEFKASNGYKRQRRDATRALLNIREFHVLQIGEITRQMNGEMTTESKAGLQASLEGHAAVAKRLFKYVDVDQGH